MTLLVRRKFSHLLFPTSSSSSSIATQRIPLIFTSFHHLTQTLPRFSTTVETLNPPPKTPFMVGYLIDSCGLSSEKALEASKLIAHIKSPSKPDAVLRFLRHIGFTDTHIRNLVSIYPEVLCSWVEKTLTPRWRALQDLGFSESQLIQLVSESRAIRICDLPQKIAFYKTLFGTNDEILRAIRRNSYLLTCSLSKTIMPNVSLLRECGISNAQLAKMMASNSRLIASNRKSVKAAVDSAEELGVPRRTGMFWQMLKMVLCISQENRNAMIKLLTTLGWSESEVFLAVKKFPGLLSMSAKKICVTLEFLTKEAGCDVSYVASHPVLLGFSLEKRLVPRNRVLRILKSKGLRVGRGSLIAAVTWKEEDFITKYILPYKDNYESPSKAHVMMMSEGESVPLLFPRFYSVITSSTTQTPDYGMGHDNFYLLLLITV